MALLAGMRITAARLWRGMTATTLSQGSTASTATFVQWGTEEATLENPGVAVNVMATLTGRSTSTSTTPAASTLTVRVGISFNGGTTWTYGPARAYDQKPFGGSTGVFRTPIANECFRTGTPTGQIQARAEFQCNSSTDVTMDGGYITLVAEAA